MKKNFPQDLFYNYSTHQLNLEPETYTWTSFRSWEIGGKTKIKSWIPTKTKEKTKQASQN